MQNTVAVGFIVTERPIPQNVTSFQRYCMIGFFIIFGISIIMVILSSVGQKITNETFWFDALKTMIGGIVGYLFGANMRKT